MKKFIFQNLLIKNLDDKFIRITRNIYTSQSNLPLYSSSPNIKKEKLIEAYDKYKRICQTYESKNDHIVNPKGVFCNNEINLKDIKVYGFDYDYTLAYYKNSLHRLIFNLARDLLIENHKYPVELKLIEYLPHFPIRGLHMNKNKGWFMKVDSYHNIQLGTVYHGMNPISNEEVLKNFGGVRLNIEDIGYTQTGSTFHQFVDLFCHPEISLLASTFQYFLDRNIHFTPEYIFQDIREALNIIHRSHLLHRHIVQSIEDYLLPSVDESSNEDNLNSSIQIKEFLTRLNKSGKSLFLITNSPFWFVNFGMTSMCGNDWTNLFDLIICGARKPSFFTSKTTPFREFNTRTNSKSWEKVTAFKKSNVYYEGNLFEMLQHTGWPRNGVLYFGDHIYGDLAEPFLKHGWRTGAILTEIEHEVSIVNKKEYQRNILWQTGLEKLLEKSMFVDNENFYAAQVSSNSQLLSLSMPELRNMWLKERDALREDARNLFNPYFGSVFRTKTNPSFFSRRLARFADIYTSNVTNLLNYPVDCHFIPRRSSLPHENSFNKFEIEVESI